MIMRKPKNIAITLTMQQNYGQNILEISASIKKKRKKKGESVKFKEKNRHYAHAYKTAPLMF